MTIEIEIELGAPSSTEEAAVFISINNIEEGFQRLDLWVRFIAVPLEVTAHPKHFPMVFRSNERCLRNWSFYLVRFILPVWANLDNLDAVTRNLVRDIELVTDVRWRAPMLEELRERLLAAFEFEFTESHVW